MLKISIDDLLEDRQVKLSEKILNWNATNRHFGDFLPVVEYVSAIAKTNGDLVAITQLNEQLNYSELEALSNQMANYLLAKGVKKGDLIGISFSRDYHWFIAIIAVLKIGAAYLPIDPDYPESRIQHYIQDSKISYIILKSANSLNYLHNNKLSVLTISEMLENQYSSEFISVKVSKTDLAYVIYTSGTTAVPKGVKVTHYALFNLMHVQVEKFQTDLGTHVLQFASMSFDA